TFAKATELFSALKTKFSGSAEATSALENFVNKPERYGPVLEDLVKEELASDPQFTTKLSELISQLGPELQIIQKMDKGEKVTGLKADEMTSGKANIVQEIVEAKEVTGAEVKKIGR